MYDSLTYMFCKINENATSWILACKHIKNTPEHNKGSVNQVGLYNRNDVST